MDRWTGVLRVTLNDTVAGAGGAASAGPFFTVAASLLLSPSSKVLAVPSVNAIFFNGDRVEGTGNPVIERLSDSKSIAEILVSKLGSNANAWVLGAATFKGPFAVYKEFVPSVDSFGNPKGYDHHGFPALTSLSAILAKSIEEINKTISSCQPPDDVHFPLSFNPLPKTSIIGFSKGGTVVNQIITELAYMMPESAETLNSRGEALTETSHEIRDHVCPVSKEGFLSSISELHYVDVGLNTTGAYINNQTVIQKTVECLLSDHANIRFVLHGTPRQWLDKNRPWIRSEKDQLLQLVEHEARKYDGRLQVLERFYYVNMPPSLQLHFEIIQDLDLS